MTLFEELLFCFILMITPLMLYLFYIAYNKKISKKVNYMVFNSVLLLSYFLLFSFNEHNTSIVFLFVSIIPLIIGYLQRNMFSILMLSIIIVINNYYLYDLNIYLLCFECLIYLVIYLWQGNKYSRFYILIHILFTFIYLKDKDISLMLINSISIYIFYEFIIILMHKGEEILKYHLSIKEIEKEKQIRDSLFKIAHEVKNPMAVCKGYFDMLDINNAEQVKKYVPIIKEEVEHTLTILQDFLSITKIKINKDIMDINMLVEEVSSSFKPILKNNHIISHFDFLDDEVYINGDYDRLKQVLINLLKNSIESMNKDKGELTIETKLYQDIFEIIIKDNGMGMSKEVIDHLSEPFFTTKKNGTGLGVSLSKEILKAHDATIKYESSLDVGTTVVIDMKKNAF